MSNRKQPFLAALWQKTFLISKPVADVTITSSSGEPQTPNLSLQRRKLINPIGMKQKLKQNSPTASTDGKRMGGGRSAGRAKQKPPGPLNKVCQRSRKLASVQVETTGRASEWIGPFPAALRI